MTKKNMNKMEVNRYIIRYFFIIFLLLGSFISGSIVVMYNLENHEQFEKIALEEKLNLRLQVRSIKISFNSIISDILFLSYQNELLDLINNNETKSRELISKEYFQLSQKKGSYDQIRYIDEKGMEIVRVNFNNGKPEIVKQEDLKYKGDRYYFKDTFSLKQNQIFVSPFDLNMEKGKIEKPFKPVIRFGVPIFDNKNKRRGVIIVNYLGGKLINSIEETSKLSLGDVMLVNSDGYWICSPVKENEWGFMFKDRWGHKFSSGFPEAWNRIISSKLSQIHNKKGLFTSATILPLREGLKSSSGSTMPYVDSEKNLKPSEYYWKIISHISNSKLKSQTRGLLIKLFIMGILLLLFGTIPSWIIAKAIVRKKIERLKLDHLAHFDKLTNVPNRTLFRDRLNEAVKDSTRYKRKFALLFIDLDNFKPVNDTLGHDVGDDVLIGVAGRLLSCVRSSDTVARIGGDEFTIILHSILEPKNTAIVAKKIIDALSAPFYIKDNEVQIGASVGISIFPDDGETIETLLKSADDAMYDAKKSGKNQYKFSK